METLIRVGQLYDRTMGFRDSANMLEAKGVDGDVIGLLREILNDPGHIVYNSLFLLLKKRKSPKASKATNDAVGPNALDKHDPYVTSVSNPSFLPDGMRIRTT